MLSGCADKENAIKAINEVGLALDALEQEPNELIYLIPARLEDSEVPD